MVHSLRAAAMVLAAVSGLALTPVPAHAADPVVTAPAGAVRGSERDGVRVFKGLPYAAPPVGPARWKPPVAAPAWSGVRDAVSYGPSCIQAEPRPGNIYSEAEIPMSEDCLSLNIWTPKSATGAKRLPVFVWIHGGALSGGSGSMGAYDGTKLARRDMVVVTINYRLGVFGYLAHPGLSAESPDRVSGNYGLLDQIAALEWVKRNIAAFGGDPDNVTIAGESAGALSVMYLMAAPNARGLFHKAIAQSAYMISTPELSVKKYGNEAAETIGLLVGKAAGAGDVAALRAIEPRTLRDIAAKAGYAPFGTVDGKVLPRQLVDTFDRGEQAAVPIIAGYNSGEIRSLRFLLPPKVDSATYEQKIRDAYGDYADAFLKLYPATDPQESALAITRDAMYGWTSQRLAEKQVAVGAPGYLYMFDHGWPSADENGLHAFHASEIPFIFGTEDRLPKLWPRTPRRAIDLKLGDAMAGYWASFAHTGKPVAKGEADWLQVGDAEAFMLLANTPRMALRPMRGAYAIDEAIVCRRRAAGDLAWGWNVGIASPPLPPATASCG